VLSTSISASGPQPCPDGLSFKDDYETRISGARRADVTGVGAGCPHVEDLVLPKSLKSGNFILAKAIPWCMGKNPA
jgi:hypothetical protein